MSRSRACPPLHRPHELRTLAREVSRLTTWSGDPETFIGNKETIARALRRMATRLERAA